MSLSLSFFFAHCVAFAYTRSSSSQRDEGRYDENNFVITRYVLLVFCFFFCLCLDFKHFVSPPRWERRVGRSEGRRMSFKISAGRSSARVNTGMMKSARVLSFRAHTYRISIYRPGVFMRKRNIFTHKGSTIFLKIQSGARVWKHRYRRWGYAFPTESGD